MEAAVSVMHRVGKPETEFVRCAWTADATEALWPSRVQAIKTVWRRLEWLSVAAGLRQCGVTTAAEAALPALESEVTAHGLSLVPIARVPDTGHYQSQLLTPSPGAPCLVMFVVGRPADASLFGEHWRNNRHEDIGRMLGYPVCCTAFFRDVWSRQQYIDTTWPMAENTESADVVGERALRITGRWQTNMLVRWNGVRPVAHLPCSFRCAETMRVADAFMALATSSCNPATVADMRTVLSWRVEWSACNGVATIRTPVANLEASTDVTRERYSVMFQPAPGLAAVRSSRDRSATSCVIAH
jgi:hypothetical protein